jgi:hypothetical protein
MTFKYTKQSAYDSAAFTSRQLIRTAASTAGAAATVGSWKVPRNMTLWGAGGEIAVNGTSTYTVTNTLNGVVTDTTTYTNATLLTFYRVSGTSTTTFSSAYTCCIGTATPAQIVALTNTGNYSIALSQGDQLYALGGTDATATVNGLYDVSYTPE